MEFILNELSLHGQFESEDVFCEYLQENLIDVLDIMDEKGFILYKKQNMYEAMVTLDKSLHDILSRSNVPIITVLKRYISQLSYQKPYWDDELYTKGTVIYQYPNKQEEPNCFTEAIEREIPILSFAEMMKDNDDEFVCYKDEYEVHIPNIIGMKSFLDACLDYQGLDIDFIMENYPYGKSICLAVINGKCYAKEALTENGLTVKDFKNIVQSIPLMLDGLAQGMKNDYWDSFRDGIFEYRIKVSAGRIFRLFFFQKQGLIFLNGFLKKSQKTPLQEIEKAIRLKKAYKNFSEEM